MEVFTRVSSSNRDERANHAFARLTKGWALARGELTAQPRSVSALAALRGTCESASGFFLDHPIAGPASEQLAKLQAFARERSTDGLKKLLVLFGVRRSDVEPWKALGLSLRTPVNEVVRAGVDLVSMRVAFEVQHDYSQASANPVFRKNATAAEQYFKARRSELLASMPIATGPVAGFGPAWGDPRETKDAFAFLARWLVAHPEYDRLTIHASGTPAMLLTWGDLFPSGVSHHVMSLSRSVAIADLLPAFDAGSYDGLLSLRAEVPKKADPDVRALSLQASVKGTSLELRSLRKLGSEAAKRLGLVLHSAEVD